MFGDALNVNPNLSTAYQRSQEQNLGMKLVQAFYDQQSDGSSNNPPSVAPLAVTRLQHRVIELRCTELLFVVTSFICILCDKSSRHIVGRKMMTRRILLSDCDACLPRPTDAPCSGIHANPCSQASSVNGYRLGMFGL